jgi:hypothetical protein
MIVVANTFMLNFFKQISIFKLNLGNSMVPMNEKKIVIKDTFILKYLNVTGKQILTYGSIGKLQFYQDFTLPQKEFLIFNDDTVYDYQFVEEDKDTSPEKYLASIVEEINLREGIKEVEKVNVKSKTPDMKLPSDQYIQEMIKKRKIENA